MVTSTPVRRFEATSDVVSLFWGLAFVLAHVLLAVAMRASATIATAHALVVALGGIVYALTTRRVRNVALILTYIAGCEVLWRMNHAQIFWEFGKYAVIAIGLVALLRIRAPRNRGLAAAYIAFLLPSVALTFGALSLDEARQEIGFNLSGPVALAVATVFFSNIRLDSDERRRALFAAIAPIVGIGALSFISTSTEVLEFENGSNFVTSGGFGPNQVSAVLGLGVMLLLLVSFDSKRSWRERGLEIALALGLAAQSALTFARGGLALALSGIAAAIFVSIRGSRRGRFVVLGVTIIIALLAKFVIEPRLDDFTSGKLSARYSSTKSSGRDVYINSEFELFASNPILGVGPGMGIHIRADQGLPAGTSHTEYTRMLAEHGILGIFAFVCLVGIAYRALRQTSDAGSRALQVASLIWVALFMLIYGTRIVAPAVMFGMSLARPPRPKVPT